MTMPVTPTVWLVVDGSGSMGQSFGGSSRWKALRSALMDSGGVVDTLQNVVRFGLVIYNGPEGGSQGGGRMMPAGGMMPGTMMPGGTVPGGGLPGVGGGILPGAGAPTTGGVCIGRLRINAACGCRLGLEPVCCQAACAPKTAPTMPMTPTSPSTPMIPPMTPTSPSTPMTPPMMPAQDNCFTLKVVDPALSNYAALNMAYPQMEVGGSTPTHRALERIVTTLPVVNKQPQTGMTMDGPTYVILATDGAPNDSCAGTSGGGRSQFDPTSAMRVVEIVTQGVQMGMRMFVISLAGNDNQTRMHLQQVAAIGSPGQMPFEPSNKGDLVNTLQMLVSGATCQVALNGTIASGQECTGAVSLNGTKLPCNAPNGWRLMNDHTLQLIGSACTTFLGSASMVQATFPCGVFIPQ